MDEDGHREVAEALRQSVLFSSLPESELGRLACRVRRFVMDPGFLFLEGDRSSNAYLLVSGRIDLSVFSHDGRELLLYRFKPGDFFGETGLLDNGCRTATAVARTRSQLLAISRGTLLDLLTRNPDAALRMLVSLSQRLRTSDQTIKALTFLDMSSRLARLLLALEVEQGTPGLVRTSHEELATALGCMRQSITRTISVWRHVGILKTSRGRIAIVNRRRLQAYVKE